MPLALSKEYLRATITATGIATATLTTYSCYMAVVTAGTAVVDGDFHTAAWVSPTDPTVVMLVGPGQTVTLTDGVEYDVYVKISGGGQTPVIYVGSIPTSEVWSYSNDPSNSTRDMVRFLIGDTDISNQQLKNAEIDALVTLYSDSRSAAIQACRILAAKYTRDVSKTVGPISISASERAAAYLTLAAELEAGLNIAAATLSAPYLSGASVNDKQTDELDTDVIKLFASGMHDDLKDLSNGGEETFERIV